MKNKNCSLLFLSLAGLFIGQAAAAQATTTTTIMATTTTTAAPKPVSNIQKWDRDTIALKNDMIVLIKDNYTGKFLSTATGAQYGVGLSNAALALDKITDAEKWKLSDVERIEWAIFGKPTYQGYSARLTNVANGKVIYSGDSRSVGGGTMAGKTWDAMSAGEKGLQSKYWFKVARYDSGTQKTLTVPGDSSQIWLTARWSYSGSPYDIFCHNSTPQAAGHAAGMISCIYTNDWRRYYPPAIWTLYVVQ